MCEFAKNCGVFHAAARGSFVCQGLALPAIASFRPSRNLPASAASAGAGNLSASASSPDGSASGVGTTGFAGVALSNTSLSGWGGRRWAGSAADAPGGDGSVGATALLPAGRSDGSLAGPSGASGMAAVLPAGASGEAGSPSPGSPVAAAGFWASSPSGSPDGLSGGFPSGWP
jgi:hypothetical protein